MKILPVIYLLFFSTALFSQPYQVQYLNCPNCNATNHDDANMTFTYDANPSVYQTAHVASDYGVRDHGVDHYDWHGGVDYSSEAGNADFGDGIVAIRGGTIEKIGNRRYKYIFIDGTDSVNINGIMMAYDFGYGHLFRSLEANQKSGNFYWQRIIGNTTPVRYAIIVNDSTALYEDSNSFVVHPSTGDTIQTTNQVTAGQVIGPIGNSISRGSVTAHLHLYLFENDEFGTHDSITKNPLQFLEHDEPNFDIELFRPVIGQDPAHTHTSNGVVIANHPSWPRFNTDAANAGITLVYPGHQTSQLIVKATMAGVNNGNTYTNAVMNTDKVEIFIKGDSSTVIDGPFFNATFNIDGRVNDEDRYPEDLITRGQGQNNRTGIQPWAYSDRRQRPWDLFNFADFATRVHEDDLLAQGGNTNMYADLPTDARYNDGEYSVYAKVTDVRDTAFYSDTLSITLDNFLPYIDRATVYISGGAFIYRKDWYGIDPDLTSVGDGYITSPMELNVPSNENSGLILRAISSEPLTYARAYIPDFSTDTIDGVFVGDRLNWDFIFDPTDTLQFDSCYTIEFFGADVSGNQLLDLAGMAGDEALEDAQIHIPIRQNNNMDSTAWSPSDYTVGMDNVHEFCLTGCTNPEDSLQADGELRSVTSCLDLLETEFNLLSSSPGQSEGAIFVELSGGSEPFSFQWTDENGDVISTEQNLVDVPAGTYCFKMQDAMCCKISGCRVIKDCTDFISHFLEDPACGGTEGNVSVIVSGDLSIPPYNYLWDTGATSKTLYDVPAGAYCVTVTDAGGCTATECHELSEGFTIDAEITSACTGVFSGAIDLSIQNGESGNYYYIWDIEEPYNDGPAIDSLEAGTYCVTVTNENDCNVEDCFVIQGEYDPEFDIQLESVTCICLGGYGAIDITVTGSSGPYSFLWMTSSGDAFTEEDVGNIPEDGEITVTVTNAYNCSVGDTWFIPVCDFDFNNFETTIHPGCDGPGTGSIEVQVLPENAAGAPFYFIWEDTLGNTIDSFISMDGNHTIDGLGAGTYCLTVLSENGCMTTSACDLIIEEPGIPEVNWIISPASTPASGDGAIDLTVEGNSGPYNYEWSNGASSEDIAGLLPGIYQVSVSYTGGACLQVYSIPVDDCPALESALAISAVVSPMSQQMNDGAINLSLENVGGYLFKYHWEGTASGVEYTTEDISGLGPDEYCVTVTHEECPGISETMCFDICGFGLDLKLGDDLDCNEIEVTALVNNGTNPMSYLWTDGSTASGTFIPYGETHCVTVTDAADCQAVRCILAEMPPLALSFEVTDAALGLSDGSVLVTAEGGIAPYSYLWDTGSTDFKISGLSPGLYCVTVTDACGSSVNACAAVECEIRPEQVLAEITDVSCNPAATGAIGLTVHNGALPPGDVLYYAWNNGAGTEDISGLFEGEYCVTITSELTGCEFTDCYWVEAKGQGSFGLSFEYEYPCIGGADGAITVHPSGGTAPFSYAWSSFWAEPVLTGNTQTFSGIPAGWYSVTVTDAMGCSVSGYTLMWPAPAYELELELVPDKILCQDETVEATVTPLGGTAPYTYSWNDCYPCEEIGTEQSINGLTAGLYTVRVTDDSGCMRTEAFYLTAYPGIQIEGEVVHICPGENMNGEGAIDIEVSGGNPPYTYEWYKGGDLDNVFSQEADIDHLTSDQYYLRVRDACDDFAIWGTYLYTVEDPEFIWEITPAGCLNPDSGAIDLILLSGYPPYTFAWSNGATTEDVSGLSAGSYSVTVSNEFCEKTFVYHFEVEDDFEVAIAGIERPTVFHPESGWIDIEVIGTIPAGPYTFAWSNGATTEDIDHLPEGAYSVTVTDSNGCIEVAAIDLSLCPVDDYEAISLETNVYPLSQDLPASPDGAIDLIISGGTPPYYIEWTKSGDPSFHEYYLSYTGIGLSNLSYGDYYVTVTDGCSSETTWRPIRICGDVALNEWFIDDICPIGNNAGAIGVQITGSNQDGNIAPYTYSWTYNGWGGESPYSSGVSDTQGWIKLEGIVTGGFYCLELSTYAGCEVEKQCFQIVRTYEIETLPWSNGACGFSLSCPGTNEGFTVSEDLIVQFEEVDNDPATVCEGYIMCPVDSTIGDYITGQELWIDFTEDLTFNTCYVTKVCRFYIDGVQRDIPLNGFFEVPCCGECDGCVDLDGDCIPSEHDEDDTDECIPYNPENEHCTEPEVPEEGLCSDIECFCGGCLFLELEEECACEVTCFATGVVETVSHYTICRTEFDPDNGEDIYCGLWLQCPYDYCNREYLCGFNSGNPEGPVSCTEEELNDRLTEAGYGGAWIYCEATDYCCEALASNFPLCEPCSIPVVGGNPEAGLLHEQGVEEWLEAFPRENELNFKVFPNPFSNELSAEIHALRSGTIEVRIVNMLGKTVRSQMILVDKGPNRLEFSNLDNWQAGIYYFYAVDESGNHAVQKMVYQANKRE